MSRVRIDMANADVALVRQIVLSWLRAEPAWNHLDVSGAGFDHYVEFHPSRPMEREQFALLVLNIFWELVVAEVIAPGNSSSDPNFGWFRVTDYGRKVLDANEYQPHDRSGYLTSLNRRIGTIDPTVLAYLDESLESFVRGNNVAAMVMLGVAAERVFDLVAASILVALADMREQKKFSALLDHFQMKPKVDWLHEKLRRVHDMKPRPAGFPENAPLMVTAIYDLMRTQRNDLGHPRDLPPRLPPGEAHANLFGLPQILRNR